MVRFRWQRKLRTAYTYSDARVQVAQDRYALGEAILHPSDRALRCVNCGFVSHTCADLRNFRRRSIGRWHRRGSDVQKWLDESAVAQDTAETERDQTELDGEG